DLSNRQGQVLQLGTGDFTLQLPGTLDNRDGRIATNSRNVSISANTLDITTGTLQHAGTGTFSLTADALTGSGATLQSNGALDLAAHQLTLDHATTTANALRLTAQTFNHQAGTLLQTGAGTASIQAEALDNSGGQITSNGSLQLTTGALLNRSATLQAAGGPLVLNAGDVDNTAGLIAAREAVTARTSTFTNARGSVGSVTDALTLTTAGFDNTGGTLSATRLSLDTQGQRLANAAGQIVSTTGAVQIHSGELTNGNGLIQSADALTVNATTLSNAGTLYARSNASITTRGSLVNSNLIAAQGNLSASAATITTTSHSILSAGLALDGSLGATGDLNLTATQGLSGPGQFLSGGDQTLRAAQIELSGAQLSGHHVSLAAHAA
ncbi:MAG TPA: hypothetical protein PKZ20_20350, partial [Rhodocyclaceae bacterium]|nr:hypothetical protein [Rhodocyclaceae bacterium]